MPEENPIKNWPERLIKEALRNLKNDGVLALPLHDFPLTLADVDPAVLFILGKLFPYFTDKALGMHGIPNVGKTLLGRIIAVAMSKYWARKWNSKSLPGFREASEFNFFRGEAGRQDRPDLFDDGSLPEQPMRKLKGFCDVGSTVLTKERWEATKLPQGQMRTTWSMISTFQQSLNRLEAVSHKEFMQMLEPAWMQGSTLYDVMHTCHCCESQGVRPQRWQASYWWFPTTCSLGVSMDEEHHGKQRKRLTSNANTS